MADIQAANQVTPIVVPTPGLPIATKDGLPSNNARIAFQQMHGFIVGANRIFPCNATMVSNVISLTLTDSHPDIDKYASYDEFAFVAPDNSTGPVTAKVLVPTATSNNVSIGTLNVYRNTGTQCDSGDIVKNGLYRLIFNDALNGGAGGFVKDGNTATALVALTNSSGGVVSDTIAAVAGTGDDTHINNNFGSLAAKVNAMMAALGMS